METVVIVAIAIIVGIMLGCIAESNGKHLPTSYDPDPNDNFDYENYFENYVD